MADKLHTLHRLRRLRADLARRDLAAAIQIGRAADAALLEARASPSAEASHLPEAEALLSAAFASWLPRALHTIEQRRSESVEAGHGLALAAAEAGARKAELQAVEELQAKRRAAARKLDLKKAQLQLDEASRRRPG